MGRSKPTFSGLRPAMLTTPKGAKPADLPGRTFYGARCLVINLTTAEALGLRFPRPSCFWRMRLSGREPG